MSDSAIQRQIFRAPSGLVTALLSVVRRTLATALPPLWDDPVAPALAAPLEHAGAASVAAPSASASPGATASGEPDPSSGEILAALRARMDEVTYEGGTPNVLAMTKRLEPTGAPALEALGQDRVRVLEKVEGDRAVASLEGALDALAAPAARAALAGVADRAGRELVLELSGLTLLDSAGVELVVSLHARVQRHGGVVRLSGARGQPLSILRLLRLDRMLTVE